MIWEGCVGTLWARARWTGRVGIAGLVFAVSLVVLPVGGGADPGTPPDSGATVAPTPGRVWNVWPLYDERDDPLERLHLRSGLGPLLVSGRSPDDAIEMAAVRPLFFWREDKPDMRLQWEVLYPLMSYTRTEQDREFQMLQLLNFRQEGSRRGEREERFDLFPFYLSGKTESGEEYHAFLPFGGRALNRLGQDELEFVLFPLYARFVKAGVETRFFPWPLISLTRGEKHSGFRIVPLYGEETREGVFEKQFLLWPLFLYQRTGLDGDSPEEIVSALPLFVTQRSAARSSTTILWPFFTYTHDREKQYEEWDLPWPLIKVARGQTRNITRLLPLFSVEERVLRNEFLLRELKSTDLMVLFPLYIRSREEVPGSVKVRDRILWWVYSDTREEGRDGSARRMDVWPFFRYVRDREGAIEFQTLALLEAFMPGDERIERNYSPLWAVYTYRRNPGGDQVWSFLWNLLRHEESNGGRLVEILGPLLAYREHGEETRLSFLGGLFEYGVKQDTRSVRLFKGPVLRWKSVQQPVAVSQAIGGGR